MIPFIDYGLAKKGRIKKSSIFFIKIIIVKWDSVKKVGFKKKVNLVEDPLGGLTLPVAANFIYFTISLIIGAILIILVPLIIVGYFILKKRRPE